MEKRGKILIRIIIICICVVIATGVTLNWLKNKDNIKNFSIILMSNEVEIFPLQNNNLLPKVTINFNDIKEAKLEKISNIEDKKTTSSYCTSINDKDKVYIKTDKKNYIIYVNNENMTKNLFETLKLTKKDYEVDDLKGVHVSSYLAGVDRVLS